MKEKVCTGRQIKHHNLFKRNIAGSLMLRPKGDLCEKLHYIMIRMVVIIMNMPLKTA